MSAKNFTKTTEASDVNKENLESPKVDVPEKKDTLESNKENLSNKEREHLKQEVLDEIKETEKPPTDKKDSKKSDPKAVTLSKSEKLEKIESILEKDLEEVYFKMEPRVQTKFKAEGEKTAVIIEDLLKDSKVKAQKIFKLLLKWLKIIPGVNKFFIKQEAKIKTDKLIKLK
ncbi:MAG: hypothetical protein CMI53_02960 [Parcubacteria group bacterium]|nr:hypothetical protein [Parcubacteria group bacterium]|tara:strand:- start:3324 stop:3839 length:516 start_codon:yes stop_codon:yes gene_type:complete